ncbi:MAG: F0F1 ATP synthase subunit gamma [Anaerolineae bacterium]|jgi:F-type H+-transporting ATPase subunit gamma|nr:F0F1 ATP synthase subunit gamma [Anaerolineae bacterium]
MAEDFERVAARLNNISSVRPILGALRTISLGSWQSAVRKQASVQAFEDHYREILAMLITDLPGNMLRGKQPPARFEGDLAPLTHKGIILIIGSERGLCGGFNSVLLRYAGQTLDHIESSEKPAVEMWVLGSRLYRMMHKAGFSIGWAKGLSTTSLPDYRMAHALTSRWLAMYEGYQIDTVDVVYNRYRGPGFYTPTITRIIPPVLGFDVNGREEEMFPPPIIETNPVGIYTRVLSQLATMAVYQCLLNSAASEHAARYSLMEEAGQNSERLIDEMTEILQMYRRQTITQEMQELAAGAGLLG